VVLPSLYGEGVPTVLLEAGASSRAIVTTDVPGCRDVVTSGVHGLVIPPGDAGALAEALERLILDPPLRRKMARAGRELILERFDVQKINQQTLDLYLQLL
jgi:glycosyltransferase involved in cell wall biosynthesis